MIITKEERLFDFDFWSGAKDNAKQLTEEQFDEIESILADEYPQGMSETEINDLFWFDFDTIKSWLGIDDEIEEDNYDEEE